MRLLYSETHPQHHHVIMGSILALNLKALDFCYHPSDIQLREAEILSLRQGRMPWDGLGTENR